MSSGPKNAIGTNLRFSLECAGTASHRSLGCLIDKNSAGVLAFSLAFAVGLARRAWTTEAEVEELRVDGSTVHYITTDEQAKEAMGLNSLDPQVRSAAADQGLRQGQSFTF
jgi:hypothetical protein